MSERFTMSEERLAAVIAASGVPEVSIRYYCLELPSPSPDDQQLWLDTGSILSIADWVRDLYEGRLTT